jgi:hypothetical protein
MAYFDYLNSKELVSYVRIAAFYHDLFNRAAHHEVPKPTEMAATCETQHNEAAILLAGVSWGYTPSKTADSRLALRIS